MESEKSEHVIRSAVAGATRMPSDGTDDDEVRERGAFPEVCFHCGRPNPVYENVRERRDTEREDHDPRTSADAAVA